MIKASDASIALTQEAENTMLRKPGIRPGEPHILGKGLHTWHISSLNFDIPASTGNCSAATWSAVPARGRPKAVETSWPIEIYNSPPAQVLSCRMAAGPVVKPGKYMSVSPSRVLQDNAEDYPMCHET
jgi:hypothetical protein